MIVKFFNRGKGRGSGAIDYLLGKNRDRPQAKLLRGHPDETAAIIDGSLYAKKYTSGVLSFEESDLEETVKRQIMDSFEECIFAGLAPNQYNCLWVEHRDKGRLELNFVIPNVELLSGKRLQPYFYVADHKRVDAWRTIQNLTYGLSDPDDPAKRRNLTYAKDLPKSAQEAQQIITDGLMNLVQAGEIRDRADIIKTLEKAGFEISRTTATSISLKNPESGKRNIRLKGALYEENFRFSAEFSEELRARSESYRAASQERFKRASDCYSFGIEKKRAENHRRYSEAGLEDAFSNIGILSYDLNDFNRCFGITPVGEFLFEQGIATNIHETPKNNPREREIGLFNGQSQTISGVYNGTEQDISLRSDTPQFVKMEHQRIGLSVGNATTTYSEQEVTGDDHDRDRKRIIGRIGTLREQLERQREKYCPIFVQLTRESEDIGERKSPIERANRRIELYAERNAQELERAARTRQELSATTRNYFEKLVRFIERLKPVVMFKRLLEKSAANKAKAQNQNPSKPSRSWDMDM